MNADERGLEEKTSPRINTDETDLEWRDRKDFAADGGAKSTPIEVKMLKYTPIWDDLG